MSHFRINAFFYTIASADVIVWISNIAQFA